MSAVFFVQFALMSFCYPFGKGSVAATVFLVITLVFLVAGLELSAIGFLLSLVILCTIGCFIQLWKDHKNRFPK